jgi:hypothetical protein
MNTCLGISVFVVLVGGSTTTGSGVLKLEVSMKKVTSRNARSTMGVMSRDGFERGIFTFGMVLFYGLYEQT